MASTNPDVAANSDIVAALQPYPTMVAVMEAVAGDADYDFGASSAPASR